MKLVISLSKSELQSLSMTSTETRSLLTVSSKVTEVVSVPRRCALGVGVPLSFVRSFFRFAQTLSHVVRSFIGRSVHGLLDWWVGGWEGEWIERGSRLGRSLATLLHAPPAPTQVSLLHDFSSSSSSSPTPSFLLVFSLSLFPVILFLLARSSGEE